MLLKKREISRRLIDCFQKKLMRNCRILKMKSEGLKNKFLSLTRDSKSTEDTRFEDEETFRTIDEIPCDNTHHVEHFFQS